MFIWRHFPANMNARHHWWNKKPRFTIAAAVFITLTIACCAFLRIARPADIQAYFGMAGECHPVWKQLALRRFSAGDPAAELFRRFPPNHGEEFGRYGVYSYYSSPEGIQFTGLNVVTRDGKLLSAQAASCTWQFIFFRTADSDLDVQYAAHYKETLERLENSK